MVCDIAQFCPETTMHLFNTRTPSRKAIWYNWLESLCAMCLLSSVCHLVSTGVEQERRVDWVLHRTLTLGWYWQKAMSEKDPECGYTHISIAHLFLKDISKGHDVHSHSLNCSDHFTYCADSCRLHSVVVACTNFLMCLVWSFQLACE